MESTPSPSNARVGRPKAVPIPAGGKVQRKLEQELHETQLFRRETENRLDVQLSLKEKLESDERLGQLAKLCDRMEPGEALRLLVESGFDDDTIGLVLTRMNREQALRVASLLKSLGRKSGNLFR